VQLLDREVAADRMDARVARDLLGGHPAVDDPGQ